MSLSRNNGAKPAAASWLQHLGLRFDPFEHLEASNEARLGDYMVGHDLFAVTWQEAPSVILAPAGGGKTAMRVYTTRVCWTGLAGPHPFPIPYLPPPHTLSDWGTSEQSYWISLMRASATTLLIGLMFRPERFLGLPGNERRQVVRLLMSFLPGNLARYLALVRETGEPYELVALLDHSYLLPEAAAPRQVDDLCRLMSDTLSTLSLAVTAPAADVSFTQLCDLLLGPLGFGSVFVLVDGADAYVSEQGGWQVEEWLAWLLQKSSRWTNGRVFLKAFLPAEMYDLQDFSGRGLRLAQLTWSSPLLAEVIRRRIWVASEGAFGSLDAISSYGLRDVETLLVKQVEPLPRETIVLARRVLQEYAQRAGSQPDYLTNQDVECAVDWYRRSRRRLGKGSARISEARRTDVSVSLPQASDLPTDIS